MSRRSRWVLGVLALIVVLLVGGVWYARPLLVTGTGYAAHNACAVALLAGRGVDAPTDDLPSNPIRPLLRTSVDEQDGRADATILGLFRSTAWYTDGLGCTIADERPDFEGPPPVVAPPADAPWPEGRRVDAPPADVDVAALESAIDDAFAEDDPEGRAKNTRAVVVVHDGRIVAERYADGFDADTRQIGWSMTKGITNAMVGRLVGEGVLDVDAQSLMPVWGPDDPRADISLDDLLRMVSGLGWDETYSLGTQITRMLYQEPDMGRFAAQQPLEHVPGTYQSYSSGTTNMVCDVLHDVSGEGVGLAHDLVFGPLGMSTAVIEPDASGGLVCSSYGWATPRDWARFGLWFLQDGQWAGQQLLPDGWIDYSTRPIDVTTDEEAYGAHWWVNEGVDGQLRYAELPADAFWASGHDGQKVVVVPSADLVVVRMGFTPKIDGDDIGVQELVAGAIDAVGGSGGG